ncbi:hypothetical protein DSL64_21415 [Dyadobacter luteus]|uniref:Lipoprotein n=1 Tax=Dyadobacter luteus TaxID=2259619 RepID=A0A3D8Y6G2_9BACT|nr:hypothetical protein [Dyadobacter luteus]REA58169.1 hypothetical protein DSL64_21415 [Dyadobacter luteus]
MRKKNSLIIFLLGSILLYSCFREASCEDAAEVNRPDDLNLIIERTSGSAYRLRLEGTNPITNKKGKFLRQNYTWSQPFIKDIAVGDTVVKRKGELKFYIHKADTILVFPFKCRGEEFN